MNEKMDVDLTQIYGYRESLGNASFAITARVAMQLGRESISNSITAIIELIKNTYDADAENVHIIFSGLRSDNPQLIIDDDGNGMSLEQLRDSWLVIGTDNKLNTTKSKRKSRVLTGEKGLGRLGLDRLCENTQLQTFVEDQETGIELSIDWNKYEKTDAKLESIEHEMYRISKSVLNYENRKIFVKEKGTRLILNKLKDSWTSADLEMLRLELSLLVSPFSGVNDFSISFFTDIFSSIQGKITSDNLLDAAEWKISSMLDVRDQQAFVNFTATSSGVEAKFELNSTWAKVFPDEKHRMPECGPISFDFYYIPRKDIPDLSLKKGQLERFMNSNQGIRIYRDGFRVMPYGKPSGEGDWLGLSLRRTRSPTSIGGPVGGWKIGYNQVVGAVFIGRENNANLYDTTNREGIIEGNPFYDLRKFSLYSIGYFERELQKYEKAQGKKKNNEYDKVKVVIEESSKNSVEAVEQIKNKLNFAVNVLSKKAPTVDIQESNVQQSGLMGDILISDSDQQIVTNNKENDVPGEEKSKVADNISNAVYEIDKLFLEQQFLNEQIINAVDQREEERKEEFQRQKDTLGNLASLGILAATFGHETAGASNLVITNSKELKEQIKLFREGQFLWVTSDVYEVINGSMESIEYAVERINTFANFTLGNISRGKRRRSKIFLDGLVKDVFKSFDKLISQDRNVEIIFDFPEKVPAINAFHIDWESILVNFITNSVYALDNISKDNRKIRVRLAEEDSLLYLSFADSGYGIAEGTDDDIFLPTFSTKKSPTGDIVGTGMGLAIVQNFVFSYNGTISVQSPCDLGGAEFHIKIPALKEEE